MEYTLLDCASVMHPLFGYRKDGPYWARVRWINRGGYARERTLYSRNAAHRLARALVESGMTARLSTCVGTRKTFWAEP